MKKILFFLLNIALHAGNFEKTQELMTSLMKSDVKAAIGAIYSGADVNFRDKRGCSPLMFAVDKCPKVVKILVDEKADVNASNEDGCSPIMIAASKGSIKNTEILLRNGADPVLRDKNEKSIADWGKKRKNYLEWLERRSPLSKKQKRDLGFEVLSSSEDESMVESQIVKKQQSDVIENDEN